MNKKIQVIIGVLAVLAILAGVRSSSYGAGKEVSSLCLSTYTGPGAGLVIPIDQGYEDYFKYVNDRGGVQGIKLKFIGIDTRMDVARQVSTYRRYRKNPKLLSAICMGTPGVKACAPMTNRDKRVFIAPATGEFTAKNKISCVFLWGVSEQNGLAVLLDWAIKDWTKKGNPGRPTIGYITWDNAYGHDTMIGGKEYANKVGVKLLTEFFPPGTPDHSIYLTRLKKANYIYVGGVEPTPSNVVRDAYRMGMTRNIQFFNFPWGPNMSSLKVRGKELQGFIMASFYIKGTELRAHPLVTKIFNKYRRKPRGDQYADAGYGLGMGGAMNFEVALKIALKDVGGYDKLKPEALYRAYQKLTGMDNTQGIQAPCTWSATARNGSDRLKLYQVKGDKIVPITDWIVAPDAVSLGTFK